MKPRQRRLLETTANAIMARWASGSVCHPDVETEVVFRLLDLIDKEGKFSEMERQTKLIWASIAEINQQLKFRAKAFGK